MRPQEAISETLIDLRLICLAPLTWLRMLMSNAKTMIVSADGAELLSDRAESPHPQPPLAFPARLQPGKRSAVESDAQYQDGGDGPRVHTEHVSEEREDETRGKDEVHHRGGLNDGQPTLHARSSTKWAA